MKWLNVKLIFQREVRDQLRDRRTMFTIFVLPLLLYPLMGMSMMQVAQFLREHPTKILVLGADQLPAEPQLIEENRFLSKYCLNQDDARLLELTLGDGEETGYSKGKQASFDQRMQAVIDRGEFDAVLVFPPGFGRRLADAAAGAGEVRPPQADAIRPRIFYNTTKDKSRMAHDRISYVLRAWREHMVAATLARNKLPALTTRPFQVEYRDVAPVASRRAAVWSKVLPFVVLIWALTGAFYPAIDLCAGEKERGTLETLLCSPAGRNEIVFGKLATVMVFSMATALLNLLVMSGTATFAVRQLEASAGQPLAIGSPPLSAIWWLVLALIPLSALFSALALGIATFARSAKEGQYYLMPLLMITLPLMMLPMLPGVELDLGTSLIPVSGVMLLLRALIEGEYARAAQFTLPAMGVTILCCHFAIRWAIDQFNNESVLFREGERWRLDLWMKNLISQREDTPTFAAAIMCGVLILMMRFFSSMMASTPGHWQGFVTSTLLVQIAFIATPALLMSIMLTRRPRRTLLLQMPHPAAIPAAIGLAVALHPAVVKMGEFISWLYPMSAETTRLLEPIGAMLNEAPLSVLLLAMALAPAICEELAFRGFILSGFRHMGHRRSAVLLSAVFFGVTHGILQQSISATAVGMVLGYLAVQTGSLLPCVLFHFTHNSLLLIAGRLPNSDLIYDKTTVVLGTLAAVSILLWVRSLPKHYTDEEKRQGVLEHPQPAPVIK